MRDGGADPVVALTGTLVGGGGYALVPQVFETGSRVEGMLSTTKRKDGKLEVTYNGHPLYYFVSDQKRGQTTGQGLNQFGAPGGCRHRRARRSTVASAHTPATNEVAGEVARYLGALSILVVGVIHAQQYYDAYFSFVPTIGRLFLLSFIGSGVVGVTLIAPVRRLGRRHGASSVQLEQGGTSP